jgi:hypothetical protein
MNQIQIVDRRLHCFYDTVRMSEGKIPEVFHLFYQRVRDWNPLSGAYKDGCDTNFPGRGCLELPYTMLIRRLGIVFDPDAPGNADLIDHGATAQFSVMEKTFAQMRLIAHQDGYCFIDCDICLPTMIPFKFTVLPRFGGRKLSGRLEFAATMSGFVDFPIA